MVMKSEMMRRTGRVVDDILNGEVLLGLYDIQVLICLMVEVEMAPIFDMMRRRGIVMSR